ncbi:unnamed protein product [Rhizoctonia solani]|uniref:Uncharacterized protein n=1 Tax=Rhizoctonia solani TaxID=456999 RepID=A0A8H2XRY2_9AGAM|nr:unnamed protein product [Rhizoctonia solani]
MNLTQDISVTPEELTTASQWATRHGATDGLMNLMRDVLRFTLAIASSPVRQSTPHIYISMLSSLKSHSPMQKHYGHRMHGMVGVGGTARDQWQRRLRGWSFAIGRHAGPATCSPDCTMLAIAKGDPKGSISLVDISSGCLVRDISQKDIEILCLCFSPDGTHLASGTFDGAIWVWDVCNGQLALGPLKGLPRPDLTRWESMGMKNHPIFSLVYSHSGSYIISGSADGAIQLWDAKSGKPTTAPLLGHTYTVISMAISPDDTKLVFGSYDKTIRVWNMQSGSLVFSPIKGHTMPVTSIAISLDGKFIVSGSQHDCTVRIWDIQTGQAVTSPLSFTSGVRVIAISPDNAHISVALDDGTIQIWDALTAKAVSGRLQAYDPECNTNMLTYSPDGTRIISCSPSYGSLSLLSLFDPRTVAMIGDVDTLPARPERILSIDISPDGKHIVSGSDRHTLRIWDINGDLIHGPLAEHASGVRLVRYSADGNRILSCSSDPTLRQWNARNGRLIQVINPIEEKNRYESFQSPWFRCAAYSPDGGHIATLSYSSDVCIWCSTTGKMARRPICIPLSMSTLKPAGISINFSTNGKTLVTSHEDGTVQVRDPKTRRLISHNKLQSDDGVRVRAFSFSTDLVYNVLIQGSDNPTMCRRFTQTGELTPGHFNGHDAEITSIQFSPDGSRIISGSRDKAVHIWDARSGTSIFGPLNGHADRVNSVAYSPDGTYVASASDDATIRIWDASTQPNSSQHVSWVIKKDGWAMDDQSRRLFWVPPELHNSLILPRNKMVISCEGYVRLNFEGAYIGEAWVNCWTDN